MPCGEISELPAHTHFRSQPLGAGAYGQVRRGELRISRTTNNSDLVSSASLSSSSASTSSAAPASVSSAADGVERSGTRPVAIKLLPMSPAAQREANIALNLPRSQHVVHTLSAEAVDQDSALLLVMELARGRDLVHWIDECGALPLDEVRSVLRGIALGLHHLHSNGVAHRDVKCDNVIYDRHTGSVKLCDLGLAWTRPPARPCAGTDRMLASDWPGTCCYAAPEVVRARDAYNPFVSDVWSLGVVAYVLLAGALPFGLASCEATRRNICSQAFDTEPLRQAIAQDPLVIDFMRGLLHKSPAERSTLDMVLRHPFLRFALDQLPLPVSTLLSSSDAVAALAPPAKQIGRHHGRSLATTGVHCCARSPATGVPAAISRALPPAECATRGTTAAASLTRANRPAPSPACKCCAAV